MEKELDDLDFMSAQLSSCIGRRLGVDDVEISDLSVPKAGYSGKMIAFTADWCSGSEKVQKKLIARLEGGQDGLFLEPDVMLDWRMMNALKDVRGIPVPPLVLQETDPGVLGAPFYIMGQVEGRVPQDGPAYHEAGFMFDELGEEQRAALWNNGLDAMARLHNLSVDDGFQFLRHPELGDTGLDQYLNWVERWYRWALAGRTHDVLDAALEYLLSERPSYATESPLWGDARIGNIIYTPDNQVAAVIDWEMAAVGPGEVDLAWWLVMDRLFVERLELSRLPGLPDRDATVTHYERQRGRKVEHLEYYEILAAFRFAIVMYRFADLQRGAFFTKETVAGTNSHVVCMVADLLGLPVPSMSPEIFSLMRPGYVPVPSDA